MDLGSPKMLSSDIGKGFLFLIWDFRTSLIYQAKESSASGKNTARLPSEYLDSEASRFDHVFDEELST